MVVSVQLTRQGLGQTKLCGVVAESDPYVLAWALVREHHMFKTFETELAGLEPSLLICGRSHVNGFLELFGERYRTVPICFGGSNGDGG